MTKDFLVKYNSLAFVLLVFVYSLTTVFSLVVNQGYLIIASALLIIGPAIILSFTYDFRISNVKALILDFVLIFVLVIEYLSHYQYQATIQSTIVSMASIGTLGLLVGSSRIDLHYCERYLKVFMYICFVLSLVYLVLIRGNFLLSMRFGYALLPSTIAFLYFFFKEHKVLYLLLFFLSVVLFMAWGSRGALLVIILYLLLNLIKKQNWLLLIIFSLVIIVSWGFLMQLLEDFLYMVADLTGARKIESLLRLVSGDVEMLEASAGRDVLFQRSIQLFIENPFGCGVGYWSVDPIMNGLYPHNILLQIATELGIVGLLFFIVCFILMIIKLFSFNNDSFLFWGMLFSIVFGRLLVSSSFWERPEFWLIVSALLFSSNIPNKTP